MIISPEHHVAMEDTRNASHLAAALISSLLLWLLELFGVAAEKIEASQAQALLTAKFNWKLAWGFKFPWFCIARDVQTPLQCKKHQKLWAEKAETEGQRTQNFGWGQEPAFTTFDAFGVISNLAVFYKASWPSVAPATSKTRGLGTKAYLARVSRNCLVTVSESSRLFTENHHSISQQ